MKKNNVSILFLAGLFLTFVGSVFADVQSPQGSNDVQALRNEMTELKNLVMQQQKMIASQGKEIGDLRLKVEPQSKTTYLPSAKAALPSWSDGLKMGGDLRLRYEAIDKHILRDRNRFRFRLRYGLEKQLNDEFTVGFRLATGTSTDPSTPNQTFTGDFTPKNIFIDRAYVLYRPHFMTENVPHVKSFEIGGGKVANPYLETTGIMFWDPDVNPEGIYERSEMSFLNDRLKPFAILGQFIFNENTTAPSDAELYAYQTGYRAELSSDPVKTPLTWTSALAFYDFRDVGKDSNFVVSGVSLAGGNTTLGTTNLAAGDFKVLNVYQDLKFKMGSLLAKVFGEYDINLHDQAADPDNQNGAYQAGLSLGSSKKKGDWQFNYYYAYIEPNSILGAISESDFGEGHANERGSNLEAYYMLTDFLKLRFKASFTERVIGSEDETGRYQIDLEWKF